MVASKFINYPNNNNIRNVIWVGREKWDYQLGNVVLITVCSDAEVPYIMEVYVLCPLNTFVMINGWFWWLMVGKI